MKTLPIILTVVFAVACGKKGDAGKPMSAPTASSATTSSKPIAVAPASSAASSAPTAAAVAPVGDDDFKLALSLLGSVADVVEKDKGKCDAMGDDLAKFTDAHAADFEKLGKSGDSKPTPAQLEEMNAVEQRVGPVAACKDQPKVKAFLDFMDKL